MGAVIAAATLLAALQACSSVPDAVNPVEWYKGARDWVSGTSTNEEAKKAAAEAPEIPGQDKPFPKVSSVPEAPRKSSEKERNEAANSLIADRENARYTDEVMRRQSASAEPPKKPTAARKSESSDRTNMSETPAVPKTAKSATPKTATPTPTAPPSPAPKTRAVPAAPPPAQVQAEILPPAVPRARRTPPPLPSLTQRPPRAPRRPVATTSPSVTPPPAPPVAPPNTSPSRLVFGPPPSDIAILQDRRSGPARAAPGNSLSIETLLPPRGVRQSPAPAPAIPSAPDPESLDPASQVAIVTFGQGSSKLSGTARRIIREVAEMQRQRGGRLHVIGHASSWTGDMNPVRHNMINFGLSLDRANTVARELLRLGFTTSEFSIGAMSDSRPLFFEVMPSGEAGNRRVEIFLDGG